MWIITNYTAIVDLCKMPPAMKNVQADEMTWSGKGQMRVGEFGDQACRNALAQGTS